MKIRLKFQKTGRMKFVGHLDMMRYFQKCMRRAGIDIAYSEGYSPHQIMSFAAPLGVGITSCGEYFDIEVNATATSREALQALNEVMVEGVEVLEYRRLPEHIPNAMSSVAAADYEVSFKEGYQDPFSLQELELAIQDYLSEQEEIPFLKQTKKGERVMNLKPLIFQMKAVHGEPSTFFFCLSTGSKDNVKPEQVMESFFSFCIKRGILNESVDPMALQVHRKEVYARVNGSGHQDPEGTQFLPLGEFGEEIL